VYIVKIDRHFSFMKASRSVTKGIDQQCPLLDKRGLFGKDI